MKHELEVILKQALEDTKIKIGVDSRALALYATERATVLAASVGQIGYSKALIAERDNVLLYAAIIGVGQADAAQQRFIGVIQGALGLGAQLLASGNEAS